MKKKPPKLKPIDLDKRDECQHPDINKKSYYLAKIRGVRGEIRFYAGTFTKYCYGWNFNAVYSAGIQLNDEDVYGSGIKLDDEDFEGLWEIIG